MRPLNKSTTHFAKKGAAAEFILVGRVGHVDDNEKRLAHESQADSALEKRAA